MSFKSKGPKSQPSQSPKSSPEPPKPNPEKDSKSSHQKLTQKPKQQPGKNRQTKNQKPITNSIENIKDNINPSPLDLNKDAKNIISNLGSQPSKDPSIPPTNSPLEPNKESKNRIIRPVFKPNMILNGKNRITRPKFKPNQHKGSKNIISRLIFDPNKVLPNKNKITRLKFDDLNKAKNKIREYKIEPRNKPKNRITRYKIDSDKNQKSNNKITRMNFKPNEETQSHNIKNEIKIPIVKSHDEIKIITNGNLKKNQNKSPKLDGKDFSYKNLLDKEIQNAFKNYHDEIGKYANYGRNLKKDFIDWMEKTEKDTTLINKVKDIQNNKEISNFIKDKIQNSSNTQGKIIKSVENLGLHVSHGTIKNISLKEIFNNNTGEYNDRFQSNKYKGISPAIRNSIKLRLIEEVKKVNPTSLYELSKEFQAVSKTTIIKIAKENIKLDLFKKTWPSAFTEISIKLKEDIINLLEKEITYENPRSLKKISNKFKVSEAYIQNLAKARYPEQYSIKWPATLKVPIEIKREITKTIREESQKENPRTLKEIQNSLSSVSYDAIKQLAKKIVPKEIHEKIWAPLCKKIPTTITTQIEDHLKKEVIKAKPRSFNNIATQFGVSREYVRKTAIRIIPQPIYSRVWEPSLMELTEDKKKEIINYIQNSNLNLREIAKKSGVHRKTVSSISQNTVFSDDINDHKIRFPKDLDLEIGTYTHKNINSIATIVVNDSNSKYFSEPKIFPDTRSSDGIIPEYNNFLKLRLKDPNIGEDLVKTLGIAPNCQAIKATQFDFTNDISEENIIRKIEKYQSPETILFIVGTKWDYFNEVERLPNNSIIKYPQNIKIISYNLFADLIGICGEERETLDKVIEFNNNKDLDALKTLYNHELSFIDTYNTNALKDELIQRKLIKNDFDEYFHFTNLKSEEKIEKQLDLDYFLNF
ncbi:MAG: hypothetical protein ACW98D_13115 [Promethearchaeota archaeon]|jgi:hypothetical protein